MHVSLSMTLLISRLNPNIIRLVRKWFSDTIIFQDLHPGPCQACGGAQGLHARPPIPPLIPDRIIPFLLITVASFHIIVGGSWGLG